MSVLEFYRWSFGVFLFELFSWGEQPYSTIQPTDILQHLESGQRLPQPPLATDEMQESCEYFDAKIASSTTP